MTPNDIGAKRFDIGMRGYKVEEVHSYLGQVAAHIESLEGERDSLAEKLELLAEKLEEYREDEDSLRAALIGAQKLGDSVVRESKRKAENIIEEAIGKAAEIAKDTQRKIDSEAFELEKMKAEVASFRANLLKVCSNFLSLIECLPESDIPISVAPTPKIIYTTTMPSPTEMEDDYKKTKEEAVVSAVAARIEKEELAEDDQDEAKRPARIRYDKIGQFFGEGNPIERDE